MAPYFFIGSDQRIQALLTPTPEQWIEFCFAWTPLGFLAHLEKLAERARDAQETSVPHR